MIGTGRYEGWWWKGGVAVAAVALILVMAFIAAFLAY